MSARERPKKRERGDGRILQRVYRVSKAGAVPPPGTPTGEWIEDSSSGDWFKWSRHRKTREWIKWKRTKTWYIAYSFVGKPRMESARDVRQGIAGTRQDAVRLLKQRREEMGLDTRGLRRFTGPDRERVTFEDLQQLAANHTTLKPRKAERSWKAAWKALAQFFGGMKAPAIDHAKLQEYVAHRLAMSRTRGTIRVELATLRHAFRLAAVDGRALCPTFPTVAPSTPRKGFFEADQYTALLAALPEPIQAVVVFLRETGWRLSEALSLQWRQIDLTAQVVRLEPGTTKNAEGRTFPYGALPDLDALLARQRARTRAVDAATGRIISRVFHDQGRPILEKRFYRAWWAATKAAQIYREWKHPETGKRCRGPIPHDFRRTAVRDLERAGVPRSAAMKITGHVTESVYARYAIVSEADLTDGVKKLAALHARDTTAAKVVAMRRSS